MATLNEELKLKKVNSSNINTKFLQYPELNENPKYNIRSMEPSKNNLNISKSEDSLTINNEIIEIDIELSENESYSIYNE